MRIKNTTMTLKEFMDSIMAQAQEIEKLSKMTNAEYVEYLREKQREIVPHYIWSESRGVVKE